MATPAPRRSARIAAKAAAAAAVIAPAPAAAAAAATAAATAATAAAAAATAAAAAATAAAAAAAATAPAAPAAAAGGAVRAAAEKAAAPKRDEIIAAAKKIVADLKNPAIPTMPDAERIATVTEIMARMRKVCHDAEKYSDTGMETLFIGDARNYCLVICGEMEDFAAHGYYYDRNANTVKLEPRVMYICYCKDAARAMENFIRDF